MKSFFYYLSVFLIHVTVSIALAEEPAETRTGVGTGIGTIDDPYNVPFYSGKIDIDANLDEEIWQQALQIDLIYETHPAENIDAPVKTEAYLIYNNRYLYIAFRAYDPDPHSIRARYTDRDNIWNDDYVMIFLDTFNDERRAYAFRSNPFGVQADDIRLANSHQISWDAIYDSKGKITDWGYVVEIAIPFNQIRFPDQDEDQIWGMNLMRSYPREVLHRIDSVPLDRDNDSVLSQFIKINGFKNAIQGKKIEIVPSIVGAKTDARPDFPSGDMKTENEDLDFGLSSRIGITTNMTLLGTINPDFSQVEADAYQLDINEPFALHYPEKRPFFQESSDYFNTLKNAVYTRMMREPLWGTKLTGKEGPNTYGVYLVRDEITNLVIPGNQGSNSESIDKTNTSSVFRYKRDFGRQYTLGVMASDREGQDYSNRLISIDGNLRLTNSDRITFQVLSSQTQYPDSINAKYNQKEGKFSDYFVAFEYDHNARNWGWWFDYDHVGSKFRADLGYIPMVGFRNAEGGVNYTWYGKPDDWWSNFHLNSQMNYYEDLDKNPLEKNVSLSLHYGGIMQSHAHIGGNITQQAYNGRIFDLKHYSSCFGIRPSQDIWLHVGANFGDRIDYANTRQGNRIRLSPELSLNLGRHMYFSISHTFEKMEVDKKRLFTANISSLSAVYHINTRIFFRTIIQYVDKDYNVSNYIDDKVEEDKKLFTQFLLSYKLNPFTVFFLGYSDNYEENFNYNLKQKNRTLFAKLSYAWVL